MIKYLLIAIGSILISCSYQHTLPIGYNTIGLIFGIITLIYGVIWDKW